MDYFKSPQRIILLSVVGAAMLIGVVTVVCFQPLSVFIASLSGTVNISATVPELQKDTTFNSATGGDTLITTQEGGTIAFSFPPDFSNANSVRLRTIVYPNAFFENDKPAPTGKAFVGNTFNFDLYNVSSGNPMTRVVKPVTITLQYTQADTFGIDQATLAPYRRESDDAEWQLIPAGTIDAATHSVTFSTMQFSSFALFASQNTPQTLASAGRGAGGAILSVIKNIFSAPTIISSVALSPKLTGETKSSLLTKTLIVGSQDSEVVLLQKYLNAHGFPVTAKGPGSMGFETNIFGARTQGALVKFQEAHAAEILGPNLSKGTGIVGPKTRNYINSHP